MKVGQKFNPYRMFVGSFLPNAILKLPLNIMSSTEKLVWARLSQYAGESGVCFPKQETLAKELGMTINPIQKALRNLEEGGFIKRIHPTGINRLLHKNNNYVFLWHPCLDENDIKEGVFAPIETEGSEDIETEGCLDPSKRMGALYIKEDPLKNPLKENPAKPGRLLKKELDSSSNLPIKPRARSTQKETPPYEAIQKLWNETVNGTDIPKIIKLTEARKKHINARMNDLPTLSDWESLIQSIITRPFLCGENDRGWTIDLDWLVGNDTNFTKVMEGKYKSSKKKQSDTGNMNWGVSYQKSDEEREEMFAKLLY